MAGMEINRMNVPDEMAILRRASDMLKEAAKKFRLKSDSGHSELCEAHKLRVDLLIRHKQKG